jgi:hypothetical protein
MCKDEDIRVAETVRSLMVIADSWENDDDLAIDEMADQLEALCDVLDGSSDFQTFAKKTNLTGRERLN